jgi:hypothetical protein
MAERGKENVITEEARRGRIWWKIGVRRLKEVVICSKDENWSHIEA